MKSKHLYLNSLFIVAQLIIAQPAHAYTDPGTGSVLLQALLAGVAGIALLGKLYWQKFKSYFSKNPASIENKKAE